MFRRWGLKLAGLTLVLLIASGSCAAAALFHAKTEEDFLADAILQVAAADVSGDGRAELLVVARNYERRETFVFVLSRRGDQFTDLWRSPNLFEQTSNVAVVAGKFSADRPQMAIITDSQLQVFEWKRDRMEKVFDQAKPDRVQEAATGRLPGSKRDVIFLTEIAEVTDETVNEKVVAWRYLNGRFERSVVTEPLGNIRSMTAGELDEDFGSELILERGPGMQPGKVTVLSWVNGSFQISYSHQLRKAPVFGLATFPQGGRDALLVADNWGKVVVCSWNGKELEAEEPISLGWGLISAAVGYFQGEALEAVVIEYPNALHILHL